MKTELITGIEVKPSTIDGKGCFAAAPFKKGRKIAEYVGEKISRAEIARRLKGRKRIHICGINQYWAIDGSRFGNGTQYINHSCDPNCIVKIIHEHIIFFAKRDIEPGEEILLDYEESYHDNSKRCSCGASNCRGRINK